MTIIFRFTDVSYFKIRGTCPALAEILDQDYVIDTERLKESIENGITFLGITGYARTTIELDDKSNRWTVFDNRREKMMFIEYQAGEPLNITILNLKLLFVAD